MWHQLKDLKPEEEQDVIVCTNEAKVFIGTFDRINHRNVWKIDRDYLSGICDFDSDYLDDTITASMFDYWTEVPLWFCEM